MASQKTSSSVVVKLTDENNVEDVTLTIPFALESMSQITTDTTLAILNAAKATVTGGGTLVQTKQGLDVAKIKESYYEYTSKTWVDEAE